jgi:K+-H+ exchange-related protein
MDVFLVPVGGDRYELYCEVPDAPLAIDTDAPRGWIQRLKDKFVAVLAEAERARREGRLDRPPGGFFARLKARFMRWVAETVAEQRLLWHLRGQTAARLHHPDDMDSAQATARLRKQLRRDFDKHQFWLAFDSLGLVGSMLLTPIPGPNFVLYYFAFRVVGHYLSVRGARQGLNLVHWATEASAPLTELRRAIALDGAAREARVHEIAGRLQLEHLATFFERIAIAQ